MTQQTSTVQSAAPLSPTVPMRGWLVLFSAVGINLILGFLYSWSIISSSLAKELKWTQTQATMPFTVATISFAIMMIFAGRMQDKLGPRLTAFCGGLLFGGGLIASSFTKSPQTLMLTYGVLVGLGIGLGYSATTPPSIKWFPPKRKGLITGIVVSGVGLASVYMAPLTKWLIGKYQIPNTFLYIGIGSLVVVTLLSLLLCVPKTQPAPAPIAGSSPALLSKKDMDWYEMLQTPQFYILWVTFVLSMSAGLLIISQAAKIATAQAQWTDAVLYVVLLNVFNTLGRFVTGYASDTIGRKMTIFLCFFVQAINMALFKYYTNPTLLIAGTVVAGICYGALFTLFPAATADQFGVKNLGVNYGIMFTAFGIAGSLGPVMASKIKDSTGSYNMSYWISSGMLVLGALLILALKPRVQNEPKAS